MQLYYSPRSPFVRKTLVAIHELGLANRVEIVPTLVEMGRPNDALVALNPLGKIPTLVRDDGAVLYDSFVIIEHLDRQAGSPLIPLDGEPRDWTLQNHALAHGLLEVLVLWRNERDKPVERQTQGWLANFEVKTQRVLDTAETMVPDYARRPFGLAHIALAVALSYLDFRFAHLDWRRDRAALAAWHETAAARPSMRATAIKS